MLAARAAQPTRLPLHSLHRSVFHASRRWTPHWQVLDNTYVFLPEIAPPLSKHVSFVQRLLLGPMINTIAWRLRQNGQARARTPPCRDGLCKVSASALRCRAAVKTSPTRSSRTSLRFRLSPHLHS